MKKIITLFCTCSILLLCFCSDNPSGTSPDPTRNCFRKFPYTATSSRIEIIEDSTFCIGIDLNHKFDTVNASYNVTPTDLDVGTYDTMLSGAIVLHTQSYTRVNSGTGLQGWWELVESDVSLVSGTLTAQEQEKIDSDTAFVNSMMSAGALQIEAAEDTIYYYYIGSTAELLQDMYAKQIEKIPNAKYIAIKIAKYSDNQITVTGQITGEVVTITSDDKFNQTLSSTNAAHETFTMYVRIEDCPIDDPLDWYREFLTENPSYAQIYIDILNASGLLASADVDVQKTNDTIVTLTGNKSKEVITVTTHTDSSIVYASTDPVHDTYETTFSEFGLPDWFDIFIRENSIRIRKKSI